MKNIKIFNTLNNKKVILYSVSAILISLNLCGCKNDEVIKDYENQISSLEQEKANLQKEVETLKNVETVNVKETLEPTLKPTEKPSIKETEEPKVDYKPINGQEIATKESKERTTIIRESVDKEHTMAKVYDYISEPFISLTGDECAYVSVYQDDKYAYGVWNYTTNNEDIPCKKYDEVSKEEMSKAGYVYRRISVLDDSDYAPGIANLNTLKEDIACIKYRKISDEKVYNDTYIGRKINTLDDNGYTSGMFNVKTSTVDIPCNTYIGYDDTLENDAWVYKYYKKDNSYDTYYLR